MEATENQEKVSLFAKMRKAKTAAEKLSVLEAELKATKARLIEEQKAAEAARMNKDRKARNKHLYSLGLAVEYLCKTKKDLGGKVLSSLVLEGKNHLASKDLVRLYEAILWLKFPLDREQSENYETLKQQQKDRAAAMRAAKPKNKDKKTSIQEDKKPQEARPTNRGGFVVTPDPEEI